MLHSREGKGVGREREWDKREGDDRKEIRSPQQQFLDPSLH